MNCGVRKNVKEFFYIAAYVRYSALYNQEKVYVGIGAGGQKIPKIGQRSVRMVLNFKN